MRKIINRNILVSHRLRGYDNIENSLQGLSNALNAGVNHIEFDIRLTKDNVFVVNHDFNLRKSFKLETIIRDRSSLELKKLTQNKLPLLNEYFEIISAFPQVKIFVDVKENGEEKQLINLIEEYNLIERTVIVSWLPEVLFNINSILKEIPLCFSHYPINKKYIFTILKKTLNENSKKKIAIDKLFQFSTDELKSIMFHFDDYNHFHSLIEGYYDHEHFVFQYLKGELLEVIQESNGMVCTPYNLVNKNLVGHYDNLGIRTVVFSINSVINFTKCSSSSSPHYILTDNYSKLISYSENLF